MTTRAHDPAPETSALTLLRAAETHPTPSAAQALEATERQAGLLRELLPRPADQTAQRLSDLIPAIHVDYLDTAPRPGVVFRTRTRWHIHVPASQSAGVQTHAVLRQLKHIIDHPLRREHPHLFSSTGWDALADYFASRALAEQRPQPTIT